MGRNGDGAAPESGRSAAPPLSGRGTYVLVLEAPPSGEVVVGKLGRLPLEGGWLLYVGSAFGSGGLRARIGRHLRRNKILHWHVDHLLARIPVSEVWWSVRPEKREEAWAEALRAAPGARVPLRGFGAGDCACEGHLIRLPRRPSRTMLPEGGEAGEFPVYAAPAGELARG